MDTDSTNSKMSQTELPYAERMISSDTTEHDEKIGFTPNEAVAS